MTRQCAASETRGGGLDALIDLWMDRDRLGHFKSPFVQRNEGVILLPRETKVDYLLLQSNLISVAVAWHCYAIVTTNSYVPVPRCGRLVLFPKHKACDARSHFGFLSDEAMW
jgi:hypothetical protein